MMSYKGYSGHVEFDDEAGIFFGRVLDLKDVVTFEGTTVEEVRLAFQGSVDDYLEFCEELGQQPDKSFSGQLPFRTTPERHRLVTLAARQAGKSINAWMDEVLGEAAQKALG